MSISREEEDITICMEVFKSLAEYFTIGGNLSYEDIFQSPHEEVTDYFITFFANSYGNQKLMERGLDDLVLGELRGHFETEITDDQWSSIKRQHKRYGNAEYNNNVSFLLRKRSWDTKHYDELGDRFMWHLANRCCKKTFRLNHAYIVYIALHEKMGLKMRKKQMFAKALKPFIQKETIRLKQLHNDKA